MEQVNMELLSSISADGQVVDIDFYDGIKFEIVPAFKYSDNSGYCYSDFVLYNQIEEAYGKVVYTYTTQVIHAGRLYKKI